MAPDLVLGATLTVTAWVALAAAVLHGRYVVDAISAGRYRKGPFERGPTTADDRGEK